MEEDEDEDFEDVEPDALTPGDDSSTGGASAAASPGLISGLGPTSAGSRGYAPGYLRDSVEFPSEMPVHSGPWPGGGGGAVSGDEVLDRDRPLTKWELEN